MLFSVILTKLEKGFSYLVSLKICIYASEKERLLNSECNWLFERGFRPQKKELK